MRAEYCTFLWGNTKVHILEIPNHPADFALQNKKYSKWKTKEIYLGRNV